MSKINQIQESLLQRSGGEFQKLADAYLMEKGFGRVNSIGSVVATNKVRIGTPDALITTSEGRYIFAEYTTQQSGLLNKMRDDLCKCLDESKTGVPIGKIERVIFCFTGKLSAAEESELADVCQKNGVNLDLFGIDALAFDLNSKYPALARDFLGVSIDSGQIVPLERFVSLYNSNKLATRLDLGFHFREEELSRLLDALEDERLIIISGRAGVGKSRLALELCERFSKAHPEYETLCIFGRNRDLWEDLQARFTRPGRFVIFVDDANRVSRFEYVVDLLQHQREDQRIKVVATVRDYALKKVLEDARPLGGNSEIVLEQFTDEEIEGLITDEYRIRNHFYLERIADIARGNPRLAVMAAEVAEGGPLGSIHDVTTLYDRYFSSIRKDLSGEGVDPESSDLLRAAALVSFFKAVDRTNKDMMNAIEEVFGITPDVFWEAADRLHEMEILDMHEDDVVRVSDQVLGTYLFYLALFKERAIDFGVILRHFYPQLRHRLIDSIYPILNTFGSERILDAMRPHVEQVWKELEAKGTEEVLFRLLEDFWFTMRTDTLLWVRDRIDLLEFMPEEVASISFEKGLNSLSLPSILGVLRQFASAGKDEARMALDLLSRYLSRRPAEVPLLLRVFIDDYGFRPDSSLRRFEVQCAVVDVLWSYAENGDPLFSRVFLAVAGNYLGTQFESHKVKNVGMLQFTRFTLPMTPELVALREVIWQRLFALHRQEYLRDYVLDTIRQYSTSNLRMTNSDIVRADSAHVLSFLESVLNPSRYLHCAMMHDYLDLLEEHDGEAPESLRDRFYNETFALAEIILMEWRERRGAYFSYEDYTQFKRNRLQDHVASYTLGDYAHFFERCLEIREALNEMQNGDLITWGAENALLSLAERDSELYVQVLVLYLTLQDPLRLNGYNLVKRLVEQNGRDGAMQILLEPEYPTKLRWLFYVHEVLSTNEINEEVVAYIYGLYEVADLADLPQSFDYLLKYLPLGARVVAEVVSIVLKKAEVDSSFTYMLTTLFNPYTEVAKRLPDLFADDLDLLKRAYLTAENGQYPSGDKAQVFNYLLDLDPNFIAEYVAWKRSRAEYGWLSSRYDKRDYAFIWARSDHQDIMDRVVESIYNPERDLFAHMDPYLKRFFPTREVDQEPEDEIRQLQDAYLLRLIDERNTDMDFMEYLFGVIGRFPDARRRRFIERFLQWNSSFEAFRRLDLEPSSWSWSGSQVPILQERVNYWGSLLPIMNSVDLLPHKQYIERHIQTLRAQIEEEKKKDFIQD